MIKNIVITGSSRGIGYGLAIECVKKGHRVMISGRNETTLLEATQRIKNDTGSSLIGYTVCDVTNTEDISRLWDASSSFGPVDIWVNNAGLGQDTDSVADMPAATITDLIDTNIKGLILCTRYVLQQMKLQGSGAIYNMEGFGSDGRKMKYMTIYGTSKSAVTYFTKSIVLETKESPVIIGRIRPGMVITNLLTDPISKDGELKQQAVKIFNILADRVETVTPFLAEKMLNNSKHGGSIKWLTGRKIMWRFLKNIFRKRHVEGLPAPR